MNIFARHLTEASELYKKLQSDEAFCHSLDAAADLMTGALLKKGTILVAGNGGSAAEAQHLAAELVVRYKTERRALPGIALTTDTSNLTAAGNDYSFDEIFARQVEALGRTGDVLILLSTSGNSKNLIRAAEEAKKNGVTTIALLGKGGGALAANVDCAVVVPWDDTPRIQEAHLLVIHALSEIADERCA